MKAESPRILYVFGAGGHGREVVWLASEVLAGSATEVRFLVDRPEFLTGPINGVPVDLLDDIQKPEDCGFVVAIGDPATRERASAACAGRGLTPRTLEHPSIVRSTSVALGAGVVIAAGSVITTNVSIGDHSHLNVGCTIAHDVRIGRFVTISPGVRIAGRVHIDDAAFLGIGAVVINGAATEPLVIGGHAVVGAGACVIRSVEPGTTVVGVPAKVRPTGE